MAKILENVQFTEYIQFLKNGYWYIILEVP